MKMFYFSLSEVFSELLIVSTIYELYDNSSLSMRSISSVGRDEEVRPTLTSQPNIAAYEALLIPEWRLEFL